jgi:hypothetical protein
MMNGGPTGKNGEAVQKGLVVNIYSILFCSHSLKNSSMIYLIHFKNLCKCYNVLLTKAIIMQSKKNRIS